MQLKSETSLILTLSDLQIDKIEDSKHLFICCLLYTSTSHYDVDAADYAVMFIESLCHTKGTWARQPFELIDWQEQIIRDIFGVLKPNGYRQFNTAYIEIPKKQGKSELAAAVALLLTCGDGEERAEVYGCAADRQQASIVFNVAADMVRMYQVRIEKESITRNEDNNVLSIDMDIVMQENLKLSSRCV